jgi:prevent-host-death family protein
MSERCVSASDFRVHLKDLANSVAAGEQRVVMARHGYRMVALVSYEDLQFLRKHKPAAEAPPTAAALTEPEPETYLTLDHPDTYETSELERLYRETDGTTDPDVGDWRIRAWSLLRRRTGKAPGDPPPFIPRSPRQDCASARAPP